MSAVFAIFVAQFMAPLPIVVGIAGAFFSRSWWHVLITALVAVSMGEIYLRTTETDHSFDPLTAFIGLVAAGLWAGWFYWLRLMKLRNELEKLLN